MISKTLDKLAQVIYDKKGINILALDIRGLSTLTDYLLIAEGNVERHVMALANVILEEMRTLGEEPIYVEGLQNGDWIALDYMQFMVHLFIPSMREKYRLERLWETPKVVDLNIKIHS